MNNVNIYIDDSYLNKQGKAKLYLRVLINKSYQKINTAITVEPDNWDKKKQIIIKGERGRENNLLLKEIAGRASDILLKYQVLGKTITKDLFVKEFLNPSVVTDFYDFMVDQIKIRHEITDSTKKGQLAVVGCMRKFRKTLLISEIDENYLKEYVRFWAKQRKKNNSINRDLVVIRTYINKAIKMELISKSPFSYFRIKHEKTYPIYLTEEERNRLLDLYRRKEKTFLPERYQTVLRQFLFSCYTGARISDLKKICFENIEGKRLVFQPKKTLNTTQTLLIIPLHKVALEMINDENPHGVRGIIFPKYVDQRINKYLKDIAELAKISKKVSAHVARHTFATLFLRSAPRANGLLILQKLLGHSKIESTMIYAHVLSEDIDSAINDMA